MFSVSSLFFSATRGVQPFGKPSLLQGEVIEFNCRQFGTSAKYGETWETGMDVWLDVIGPDFEERIL